MAAEKKIGHGTILKQGSTTLSQIRNITPPGGTREEVPATTFDSTVEETLPADPENCGELQFEQIWTKGETDHDLIDTAFNARTIDAYSIVYPWSTAKTATFSGWVKSMSPATLQSKEVMARTVVIKLTTTITWT